MALPSSSNKARGHANYPIPESTESPISAFLSIRSLVRDTRLVALRFEFHSTSHISRPHRRDFGRNAFFSPREPEIFAIVVTGRSTAGRSTTDYDTDCDGWRENANAMPS